MQKKRNVLIVLGPECELESIALRSSLEFFGYNITLKIIGRPNDFINLFTYDKSINNAGIIILCFHGINKKFKMPILQKHQYEKKEIKTHLGLNQLKNIIQFNKQTVICTGCALGYERMAKTFLKANASCYIGTSKYIDEDSVLIFTTKLFYHLGRGDTIKNAFLKAKKIDTQTSLFELFC
jgi:hypothetical protein